MRAPLPSLKPVLVSLLALSLVAGYVVKLPAKEVTREEALAQLYSPQASVRRDAVDQLARVGKTADADLVIEALRDADPEVRAHAGVVVWVLWTRSGDPDVDALLQSGIERMQAGQIDNAVELFTRVIQRSPEFAEGWNKRATAYYLMGDFEHSLSDCDEVIKRNPQHFGALSGYGMIYVRLGKLERALEYFERALQVNPNLEGVEESIELIRYKLRKDGKQDI